MYNNIKALICLAITGLLGISCADTADIENRLNDLEGRLDNIEPPYQVSTQTSMH